MIVAYITPAGLTKVSFNTRSDDEQDLCLAVWPLVRKELHRLDRKLKKSLDQAVSAESQA